MMNQKMPCEVHRHDGTNPSSAELFPCLTKGGNIDKWHSITVRFLTDKPNEVSTSGTNISGATAARIAAALIVASALADGGAALLPVLCEEVTPEQTTAYYAERKAAVEAQRKAIKAQAV